jgi:cell wall-associated NlpC family hydrolase
MRDLFSLIGTPYELGADGSQGKIDCIHLVYAAWDELGIMSPEFDYQWYEASFRYIARAILRWGARIQAPYQDGDLLLLPNKDHAFAVVWQSGILYINRDLGAVSWCPLTAIPRCQAFRCRSFPMSGS